MFTLIAKLIDTIKEIHYRWRTRKLIAVRNSHFRKDYIWVTDKQGRCWLTEIES